MWLYTDRSNPSLNRKFQSFWSGPYRVIKQISNTIFEIESYGRWSKERIVTSAAVDQLKKCYVADPETNLGVPVELTAADIRPYFENQELLGRLPASEFAPHVFDKEQELPLALFSHRPRDDLPTTPSAIGEAKVTPALPVTPRAEKLAEPPAAVPTHAEPSAELAPPEELAPEPELLNLLLREVEDVLQVARTSRGRAPTAKPLLHV